MKELKRLRVREAMLVARADSMLPWGQSAWARHPEQSVPRARKCGAGSRDRGLRGPQLEGNGAVEKGHCLFPLMAPTRCAPAQVGEKRSDPSGSQNFPLKTNIPSGVTSETREWIVGRTVYAKGSQGSIP